MEVFKNMTYLDFSNEEIANQQKAAIRKVEAEMGKEWPNIINGKEVFTEKKTVSINPGNNDEIIGTFQKGGQAEAEDAIQSAAAAFETWKKVPAEQRASYLFKAAEICKQRRLEINAWMICEAGKSFLEADADTCEAIDFLEFYAREMIRYSQPQPLTPNKDEDLNYFYIPLGVGLCIPPWNFPFAIMLGIASAAIVSGNTVVLKPSSESPMMAKLFVDIMKEVGLPDGVLNFFVASGAQAGDYMVQHPKTRFISFTGSMEVGLRINELAAKRSEGQIWIKRVIAEMGGKDTMVIDHETNVDNAVAGTLAAAFGFQGQKCSACSRVVVDEKIYAEFVEKLVAGAKEIKQGDQKEDFFMGPVISAAAEKDILNYIEIGKKEGKLLCGGNKVAGLNGFYIEPTIFGDIDPMATISQEEIFGPVLAVIKSTDFDNGLEIANNTIFGLTGAAFSDNREKLEKARSDFHVGNLYLNRKCTGALVDVHPFGGFNMSGTDSKAGSRDYLALFQQGKSCAEKV
jgi:1-pyrroline-5-carboxylate dehydrogenase